MAHCLRQTFSSKNEIDSARPLLYQFESHEKKKISIKTSPAECCMKFYLKDQPNHYNTQEQLKPESPLAGYCKYKARFLSQKNQKRQKKEREEKQGEKKKKEQKKREKETKKREKRGEREKQEKKKIKKKKREKQRCLLLPGQQFLAPNKNTFLI